MWNSIKNGGKISSTFRLRLLAMVEKDGFRDEAIGVMYIPQDIKRRRPFKGKRVRSPTT